MRIVQFQLEFFRTFDWEEPFESEETFAFEECRDGNNRLEQVGCASRASGGECAAEIHEIRPLEPRVFLHGRHGNWM